MKLAKRLIIHLQNFEVLVHKIERGRAQLYLKFAEALNSSSKSQTCCLLSFLIGCLICSLMKIGLQLLTIVCAMV
jgi:hypothetical protein